MTPAHTAHDNTPASPATMAKANPPSRSANPLERLAEALKPDMAAVNALIIDRMQSNIPLIPQLAGHLIAGGGKRIRPLLTLASAALFDYKGSRQHKLAACVEFIHTATLLHDDVVDESDQRRGKASANAVFGNEAAVLVGDFLFSRSFQLMVEDGSLEVLRILSNASAVIAEGEVLQLSTTNNIDTTEADYLKVIGAKTAELFAAACEVGGIVADRPAGECAALRDYGMYLGYGFQISDDVLDYAASEERLGKSLGDDFKEGKMTLPVLKALAKASPAEKDFWQRTMCDLDQKDGDLAEAQALIRKHKGLDLALAQARDFAAKGRKCLEALPGNGIRQDLAELIDFAVERDY
ncbi:MAG: polyprenyl synthetase family protein [Alphaproteobacteria bacterium]|nr:polyprenyl synthetase family protein [Alphaproteobacteria bacterium]